eukprot:2668871-Prymnesium_polylepis.1
MQLDVRDFAPEVIDESAAERRCPQRISGDQYYQRTGNDYRGEFRALESAWGHETGREVLSRIAYNSEDTARPHLRACAWLDACLHAPVWWSDHRARPFYIAAVRTYSIHTMQMSTNRQMWSLMTTSLELETATVGLQEFDHLRYYRTDRRCAVHIEGSKLGFFASGWLEKRRVQRHMYDVQWSGMRPATVPSSGTVLLGGFRPLQAAERQWSLARFSDAIVDSAMLRGACACGEPVLQSAALAVLQSLALVARAEHHVAFSVPAISAGSDSLGKHAGLWGLTRTARQEMPTMGVNCVELPAAD